MDDDDDDDEGGFGGLYENGHWVWSDNTQSLAFVSDLPPELADAVTILTKAPTGAVEFRDDVDLIEQLRFRRRYQRKLLSHENDIITLQDIKDIALYTAPLHILSVPLINMLHLPTTERFIRALIFYCQYYLQVADEMSERMMELETKVRTPNCEILETIFRDNMSDLRLLVAKEYSTMLISGSDMKRFHHMGPQKKRRSLSDKDARLFETLLLMCIQIVWLALGRKAYNQIELEVNRLFKTEIFNMVEHNLKTGYIAKMGKEERLALLGKCLKHEKKIITESPLMNEVFCHRNYDYRMLGLATIDYDEMTPRLQYMLQAVAEPEEGLYKLQVSLGIIGKPRSLFDTMLRPLNTGGGEKSKHSLTSSVSVQRHKSSVSSAKSVMGSKKSSRVIKLYDDIVIPLRSSQEVYFPSMFPCKSAKIYPCSEVQRRRWQNRLVRLQHPQPSARS